MLLGGSLLHGLSQDPGQAVGDRRRKEFRHRFSLDLFLENEEGRLLPGMKVENLSLLVEKKEKVREGV